MTMPVVEVLLPSRAVVEVPAESAVSVLEIIAESGVGVVELVTSGRSGPPGPPGPVGPPSPTLRYVRNQPASVWTIVHNLGFDPAAIIVISSDGFQLDGFGVQYLVPGESLRLAFDISVAGVALLS